MSAEELEELDRTQPGWDRDARRAACESALRTVPRETLVSIYGEELVREAEAKAEGRKARKTDS